MHCFEEFAIFINPWTVMLQIVHFQKKEILLKNNNQWDWYKTKKKSFHIYLGKSIAFWELQFSSILVTIWARVEHSYVLTKESWFSVSKTKRPEFWQSGNKTARAVKISTTIDLVASARKGLMKKMHRRCWCQD